MINERGSPMLASRLKRASVRYVEIGLALMGPCVLAPARWQRGLRRGVEPLGEATSDLLAGPGRCATDEWESPNDGRPGTHPSGRESPGRACPWGSQTFAFGGGVTRRPL